MKITDISQTKKGRFAISVDGEFVFSLHMDIFIPARVKVGDDLTVQELEELRKASDLKITKERALRLLGTKGYTTKALYDKLLRYADEEAAEAATVRMAELGLLDDADYAMRCARDLYNLKHFSKRRIVQELKHRGIDSELAETAAEQFDEDEAADKLKELIERKYMRYLHDEKGRTKITGALARLGYGYEDIKTAIREAAETAENAEDTEAFPSF